MCNRVSCRFLCGHTTREDHYCLYAIFTMSGLKRVCSGDYGYLKIRAHRICDVCDLVRRVEDEIEIEDMVWDDEKKVYHYPCPCGDRFEISRAQLANYEDIATCPSCSLIIRVVYDPVCLSL